MPINIEVVHSLVVTLHNASAGQQGLARALGQCRLQLEGLMVQDAQPMTEREKALPNKMHRVQAYRDRTGVSLTLAHAVINMEWRKDNVRQSQLTSGD